MKKYLAKQEPAETKKQLQGQLNRFVAYVSDVFETSYLQPQRDSNPCRHLERVDEDEAETRDNED